jgi:two-component system chemotaxis sensor kinase CheA
MSDHAVFVEEARDLLSRIERALQGFEAAEDQTEVLHEVFRAAHTLKGAAGVFGFDAIVQFAHGAESLLDRARDGEVKLGEHEVHTLLAAHDELVRLVECVETGAELTGDEALATTLLELAEGKRPPKKEAAKKAPRVKKKVEVRFGAPVMKEGFDPLDFLEHVAKCGKHATRTLDLSAVPLDDSFDPERCYLGGTVELETDASDDVLRSVFDFILDSTTVTVSSPATEKAAEKKVEKKTEKKEDAGPAAAEKMVKVPASRLDALIDLVGELVIAAATSDAASQRQDVLATREAQATVTQLVSTIRDTALSLRMVPIGETFSRFNRLVRDVSKQLGKDIALDIKGADTELDKSIVERLVDPLTHIVRNSLDHGVETSEARIAAGKPGRATLTLNAFHEGGSIVVDVRDDGRGLDRVRIRKKAVEKGLIAADAQLSDEAIDELIFVPGFSSADQVSELSGRGVGMDVVRRSVEALRGAVEVLSTPGQGTTVRLRVPLTLAIIDGFQVGVGARTWVVPLELVHECVDLPVVLESETHHRLDLRGEVVPFVRLREFFAVQGDKPARECVVVVEEGGKRVGLVVDRLLGASQAVIKPLGPLFQNMEGLGGATLLGTGEVGFVVDVAQVVRRATGRARPGAAA